MDFGMRWLKSIGSFLTGGSGDGASNVMKVASGIGNWIDKGKFTDQEKAEFNAAIIPQFQKFMDSTVAENTQRSKSRREIALLVIRWELIMLTVSAVLFKLDPVWAKYVFDIATLEVIVYLVLGIGGFFFGAHLIRTQQGK